MQAHAACSTLTNFSVLVTCCALVPESISDKIEEMRKGKSDVLESRHTLILGWSDKAST